MRPTLSVLLSTRWTSLSGSGGAHRDSGEEKWTARSPAVLFRDPAHAKRAHPPTPEIARHIANPACLGPVPRLLFDMLLSVVITRFFDRGCAAWQAIHFWRRSDLHSIYSEIFGLDHLRCAQRWCQVEQRDSIASAATLGGPAARDRASRARADRGSAHSKGRRGSRKGSPQWLEGPRRQRRQQRK